MGTLPILAAFTFIILWKTAPIQYNHKLFHYYYLFIYFDAALEKMDQMSGAILSRSPSHQLLSMHIYIFSYTLFGSKKYTVYSFNFLISLNSKNSPDSTLLVRKRQAKLLRKDALQLVKRHFKYMV